MATAVGRASARGALLFLVLAAGAAQAAGPQRAGPEAQGRKLPPPPPAPPKPPPPPPVELGPPPIVRAVHATEATAALFEDLRRCAVPVDLDAIAGTTGELGSPEDPIKTTAVLSAPVRSALAPKFGESVVQLIARRPDLMGLPVRGASECTAPDAEARKMEALSRTMRTLLAARRPPTATPNAPADPTPYRITGQERIESRDTAVILLLKSQIRLPFQEEDASILVQMLQADDPAVRVQLVRFLAAIPGQKAGAALARLAQFDLSTDVRDAAVAALRDRPAEQYRSTLLAGFRYPWAPVADHAAAALVAVDDRGAIAGLTPMLDLPDPAAPMLGDDGKWVKAELVTVNHLRNCLLCHAPSSDFRDHLRGLIPTPGQPPPEGYHGSPTGRFVRADVTYLREDFSVLESVANAGAWPEQQRYDYLVRRRPLTDQEMIDLADLGPPAADDYPQREAVRSALTRLNEANSARRIEAVGLGP